MKILLVLLACFAASNASLYSYNYYCQQRFCVYPQSHCFNFRVNFLRSWYTYQYYEKVVHFYPGEDCGKDTFVEKTNAEVQLEMENLLSESVLKIAQHIIKDKNVYSEKLRNIIADYKESYKTYITKYYQSKIDQDPDKTAEYETERDGKIAEYDQKLDDKFTEWQQACGVDSNEKLNKIREYHKKLVENAVKCLETRTTKLTEYNGKLLEKIQSYVKKFTDAHMAVLTQKKANLRCALEKIHGDKEFAKAEVDALIAKYHEKEMEVIDEKVIEYTETLTKYQTKLEGYYFCAYRCYLTTGCHRFYKRCFYSSCQRLRCWYGYKMCYNCRSYCISPIKFTWRSCSRYGWKTCDLNTLHKTPEELEQPMLEKMNKAVTSYEETFNAWKTKWEQYHNEYITKYEEIITERHAWYEKHLNNVYLSRNNGEPLTPEQIAEIAKIVEEMKTKKEEAVQEYKTKLAAVLAECKEKFEKSITEYKEKVTALITKIIDAYRTCLTTRTEKIEAYKISLQEKINKYIEDLTKAFEARKVAHVEKYIAMLQFYLGKDFAVDEINALAAVYGEKVKADYNVVIEEVRTFYNDLMPKQIEHYSCCYICGYKNIKFGSFCYGSYYSWRVCYPKSNCYQNYYSCYRRYHCYRYQYYSGRYCYCA